MSDDEDDAPGIETESARRIRLHTELLVTATALEESIGPLISYLCQTEPTEAPPAGFKPSWFASYAAIKAATADPASSRLTRLEAAHELAYVQLATDEIPVGAYRICAYKMKQNQADAYAIRHASNSFCIGCALLAVWEVGLGASHPSKPNLVLNSCPLWAFVLQASPSTVGPGSAGKATGKVTMT
jgi:hypothetical protein